MQVTVITFTEQDLDLVGRVFLNEDKMKEAIAPLVDPIDYTVDEYLDEGLVDWSVVPVEGFGDTEVNITTNITPPNDDYRTGVTLRSEDEGKSLLHFSVREGEPEDMIFGRDLGDCLAVYDLIDYGYKLALAGKSITFNFTEEED